MFTVIGCDPGRTGAFAFLSMSGELLDVQDMPIGEVVVSGKARKKISAPAVGAILRNALERFGGAIDGAHFFMEELIAMPSVNRKTGVRDVKPGTQSMMSFGRGGGINEGACGMAGIPVTIVAPAAWKAAMGCQGGKDGARLRVMQLFPAKADLFAAKGSHNRAEAVLIGLYGAGKLRRN